MSYTVETQLRYNHWANTRLAESFRPVDEQLFSKEIVSSFSSLRKTVLHIWDAEKIWLSRLNGVSPDRFPLKEFSGNKDEALAGLVESSASLLKFVQNQPAGGLERSVKYKNLKGEPFENTAEGILFHVVNHGSYHRGQAVTLLRQLGITEVQSTDLIVFLRTQR